MQLTLLVTNRLRMCSVDLNVNKMSDAKEMQGRPAGRPVSLTNSAKKRKKSERNAHFNKTKVYIGIQFDRWIAVKEEIGVNSHTEVAKVLLDR